MSETYRYSPNKKYIEYNSSLKKYNFENLPDVDSNSKSSIKNYYKTINTYIKKKKTLKCEKRLSSFYQSKIKNTKNNLKKQKREQKRQTCLELEKKDTSENTLVKSIYDSLIKNYKEKLSKLTKNQNPNVSDINKIAEYISIIQYIYSQSNCSNRLSMTDLISKMKTSNKFNKLNDSYIEYIMYNRENAEKVIKGLNVIHNFNDNLTTIITQLPECSSNQSSKNSRYSGYSGYSYV